jgi:hypothetical protein
VLEQLLLLFGVHELADVAPRARAGSWCADGGDLCADELCASRERVGDAVVAVLDEVAAADLEDVDRRGVAVGECGVEGAQPIG